MDDPVSDREPVRLGRVGGDQGHRALQDAAHEVPGESGENICTRNVGKYRNESRSIFLTYDWPNGYLSIYSGENSYQRQMQ